MRFSCEKNALNEAVSVCIHAVGTKGTSPVMEGLLLEAGGTLTVTGFNYKTAIQKNFDADVTQPGSVVLNARILAECCFCRGEPAFSDERAVLGGLTGRQMTELLGRLVNMETPWEETVNPAFDWERFRALEE